VNLPSLLLAGVVLTVSSLAEVPVRKKGLDPAGGERSKNAGSRVLRTAPAPAPFLVKLRGTSFERGLQHGTAIKGAIDLAVQRWKTDLRELRNSDPDLLIAEFLQATEFMPAIQKWTPDLLEEVRGMAEGSGQPFETMLAYQLVDELWVYLDEPDAHHCSSVGVARRGHRPAFIAQNLDLESFRHGTQTVLHIRPPEGEPEQLVFTTAGLIGAVGVNRSGVAVGANTLMQLQASKDGLPVAFLVRGVLARMSEPSALTFLNSVKHASGQNYMLGIGGKVFDFEASARGVTRYRPCQGDSPVFHTNHPLVNRDLKHWHTARQEGGGSESRFDALRRRFGAKASDLSEKAAMAALRSRDTPRSPLCRSLGEGRSSFTFGSVIMTLSDPPSLQVTCGPPDVSEYVRYSFAPTAPKPTRTRGSR